jgi:putative membrane protein
MFWLWGPGWGWVGGIIMAAFWVGIIVLAVFLLRQELPHLHARFGGSEALRILEERYARGEVSREEFLDRRRVLLAPGDLGPPPPPPPDRPDPTEPIHP